MSAKSKKDSGQPELPGDGQGAAANPPAPAASASNGEQHVVAESMEGIVHKPFDPKKLQAGLHTRANRGFLDYASYVIRDRAIPNLA
ncbi:MAG TPA: DNA topoisomerase IV subunit A, partial [Verrucomicrobiae bacterium]